MDFTPPTRTIPVGLANNFGTLFIRQEVPGRYNVFYLGEGDHIFRPMKLEQADRPHLALLVHERCLYTASLGYPTHTGDTTTTQMAVSYRHRHHQATVATITLTCADPDRYVELSITEALTANSVSLG
jgi:hypothetical protein